MVQITFTGFDGSSVDIDVEQADTVGSLRPRLAELLGVEGRCRVKLTKGLSVLDDSDPVPTWASGNKEHLGYALIQRQRLLVATSRWQRPTGTGLAAPSAMLRVFDADVTAEPVDIECGGPSIMALAKISEGCIASTDPHDAAVVSVWSAETGERQRSYTGHERGVTSICALGGEGFFATGGEDTDVRIWGASQGDASEQVLSGHEGAVYALAAVEPRILASGCSNNSIRIWDVAEGEAVSIMEEAHAHGSWIHGLAALDCGMLVSCTDTDPDVKVWDSRSSESPCVLRCSGHGRGPVRGAWAVCAAGNGFASGGVDGVVRMWDVRQTTEPYLVMETAGGIMDGGVEHLAVLKDGLFGTKGDAVYKWNSRTGALISSYQCPGKAQAMCIF